MTNPYPPLTVLIDGDGGIAGQAGGVQRVVVIKVKTMCLWIGLVDLGSHPVAQTEATALTSAFLRDPIRISERQAAPEIVRRHHGLTRGNPPRDIASLPSSRPDRAQIGLGQLELLVDHELHSRPEVDRPFRWSATDDVAFGE